MARHRPRRGGRRHVTVPAVAAALALTGAALLMTAWQAQPPRPPVTPTASAAGTIPPAHTRAPTPAKTPVTGRHAPATSPVPLTLPRSVPLSVRVPAIGVRSGLVPLGLRPDQSIEVPTDFADAGWYVGAPTPGQLGPAVVLGHIDSYRGPAVFFRLAALRPGDQIIVNRADRTDAAFSVDAIRQYPKNHFPTKDVYGDIGYAGLRLISCGGQFDKTARSYDDNIVVFAHLTARSAAAGTSASTARTPDSRRRPASTSAAEPPATSHRGTLTPGFRGSRQ